MTIEEKEAINYARVRLSIDDYPVYNDEYELMLAFEAGAEWMANQGETEELTIESPIIGPPMICCPVHGNIGDRVIVQIRKV